MILTSYHTHTARCKHAAGTERDYLESAIENSFQVLGFTDHVAWPFSSGYVSPVRMDVSQMDEYAGTVLGLKEEYAPRIRVHLGAECEYFPDYLPWLREERERLGLEYLILGVHVAPNEEGHEQFASAVEPDQLLEYTDLAIAGMETGMFRCLCHPDLPLKTYPRFDRHARQMSERLCAAAKRLDMPLEYNLAGVRLRGAVPAGFGYTSDEFWQIAAEYGCTAVIASDAHRPQDVGDAQGFRQAFDKLAAWGVRVLDLLPGLD